MHDTGGYHSHCHCLASGVVRNFSATVRGPAEELGLWSRGDNNWVLAEGVTQMARLQIRTLPNFKAALRKENRVGSKRWRVALRVGIQAPLRREAVISTVLFTISRPSV